MSGVTQMAFISTNLGQFSRILYREVIGEYIEVQKVRLRYTQKYVPVRR